MTWEEIKASNKPVLRPQDIAEVIGCHPQVINILARQDKLPFPAFRSGNRTKIPREGFVAWMKGGAKLYG